MSWRDADDPRCPECGEKISPTAYYCMHCHADLPGDPGEGSSSSTPDEVLADDTSGESSEPTPEFMKSDSSVTDVGDSVPIREGHVVHKFAGSLVSMLGTDIPEPENVPQTTFTAPLWMRIPIAIISGFFVFMFVGTATLVLLGEWLGALSGIVTLVLFVGIITWLARKPLPSDIIADASYAVALTLLAISLVMALDGIISAVLLGTGTSQAQSDIIEAVLLPVFVSIPAGFFLTIGYIGNRYARSKLDSLAESATGSTRE